MTSKRALFGAAVLLLVGGPPAGAQVVRDGSLGSGVIGPGFDSDGMAANYVIDETHGALSGTNLYHSFSDFSVGSGEVATFTLTQPLAIDNVVSRVTGGNISEIDGTIRSSSDLAGAAVFLLNRTGISFGQEAKLELGGSFHASSADILRFEDGFDFDAVDTAPAVLSVDSPSAFGFSRADPGFVTVSRSQDLGVPAGETLSLIGGFDSNSPGLGGVQIISTSGFGENILAPDATVQLAAARPGIDLPLDLGDLDMETVGPGDLGNVVMQNSATVDVSTAFSGPSPRGGEVVIRGENFVMAQRSVINARNGAGVEARGPVDIAVVDTIDIGTNSQITTWAFGAGKSGDVLMNADKVIIGDADLQSFSTGGGEGGSYVIDANDIDIEGGLVQSLSTGQGQGGRVGIYGGTVDLTDGGRITSETFFDGMGGEVYVEGESLTISNAADVPSGTLISTNTLYTGSTAGDGGALRVDVATLDLEDGGQLFTRTSGAGNAGALHVTATESARLEGEDPSGRPSGITSRALQSATGSGGLILIDGPILEVVNGAQIAGDTFGAGPAGNLEILVTERVTLEGGDNGVAIVSAGSFNQAGSPAQLGPGGTLHIDTGDLELRNGGQVSASATGTGNAGNIVIEADQVDVYGAADPLGFNDSGIFSQSLTFGVPNGGDGGDIGITSFGDIEVFDGGKISARSDGTGNGGSIALTAADGTVSVRDQGQVTASASGTGDAGTITINAKDVEISGPADPLGLENSGVFSQSLTFGVANGGDGGDIRIVSTRNTVVSDSGQVSASSEGTGDGGDIAIRSYGGVKITREGLVSARSDGSGSAGDILVQAADAVRLKAGGEITTEATSASGGNITVNAGDLVYLSSAAIETNVEEGLPGENAGDVNIGDPQFTVLNDSHIIANARGADVDAGNIRIATDFFFISGESFLQASAEQGVDGEIEITSPSTNLTGALTTLSTDYLDASALLAQACAARTSRAGSFTVQTREGIPPLPDAQQVCPLEKENR